MNLTVYHGTEYNSAKKIQKEKILKGDAPMFGPGVCTTIEQALNYSVIKSTAVHGAKYARKMGRIAVIECLPYNILNTATKDSPNGYTLNNELGHPMKGLHFSKIRILDIDQAQVVLQGERARIEEEKFNPHKHNLECLH